MGRRSRSGATTGDLGPALDAAVLGELRAIGGVELVGALATVFVDGAPARRTDLRSSLRAGDGAALRVAAHTLKGAAASVGAASLASRCAALEVEASSGVPATWASLVAGVEAALTLACEALAGVRAAA